MSHWTVGLAAGLLSALFFFSTASGSLFAALPLALVPLPLFLAGLGWGGLTAAFAALTGFVLLSLASSFSAGLAFVLFAGLPAFWLSRQSLFFIRPVKTGPKTAGHYPPEPKSEPQEEAASDARPAPPENVIWCPPGDIAVWTALTACAVLLITEAGILIAGLDGLAPAIRDWAHQALASEAGVAARALADEGMAVPAERLIALSAAVIPAAAAAAWSLLTLANMAFAQRLLAGFGHNLRPSPDYDAMELPRPLLWVFLGAFVLSFIPGEMAYFMGALVIALFVPYFLLGLAVIHAISRAWKARIAVLGLFYFLLLIFGWLALPVGILGMMDPWLTLRARFGPGGDPGKERD